MYPCSAEEKWGSEYFLPALGVSESELELKRLVPGWQNSDLGVQLESAFSFESGADFVCSSIRL